ncbi:glycosyltransferase family 4 protein [uncultured Marivita sp.]|uniref:glycosyltransferase family 4 protein n=1 Tax=uncultured Marivita sp. TaxID=888080 RepID=UPI00261126F0|nr:glycosyltransferase family 4 protein [uncultured Marivita sp.]
MTDIRSSICLFIGTLKAGGAERVTVWLASELNRLGHEVVVLTHSTPETDFFSLPAGIKRETVGFDEGRSSLLGKLIINLRRCLQVRKVLRRHRVSAMLAMMPHESVMAVVSSFGTPTRVVVSERNAPWHRKQDQIWTILRRLVYRFSDCQVAQTQPISDWLQRETGSRNVAIIPNAVQSSLPSGPPIVRPKEHVKSGRKLLLAVGTKPYQKGFDILIEAFALVAGDHPEWDLAILGLLPDRVEEGISGRNIRSVAAKSGLTERVFLPGHLGNVSDWYTAADLFVLSSRFEGFPNVLVEAMSAGCACVAFDCDTGPKEIIEDNVDGILVRDLTAEALASALDLVMSDPQTRSRLAETAPRVSQRYDPSSVLGAWCRVLDLPDIEQHK